MKTYSVPSTGDMDLKPGDTLKVVSIDTHLLKLQKVEEEEGTQRSVPRQPSAEQPSREAGEVGGVTPGQPSVGESAGSRSGGGRTPSTPSATPSPSGE